MYPDELCKSRIDGLVKQMKEYCVIMNGGIGSMSATEEIKNAPWQDYYDDMSGERLNNEMVEEAIKKNKLSR